MNLGHKEPAQVQTEKKAGIDKIETERGKIETKV